MLSQAVRLSGCDSRRTAVSHSRESVSDSTGCFNNSVQISGDSSNVKKQSMEGLGAGQERGSSDGWCEDVWAAGGRVLASFCRRFQKCLWNSLIVNVYDRLKGHSVAKRK